MMTLPLSPSQNLLILSVHSSKLEQSNAPLQEISLRLALLVLVEVYRCEHEQCKIKLL
jgi:hypothetical protein